MYHLLLFATFFLSSLLMVRMIDFFSLVAALFIMRPLASGLRQIFSKVPQPGLVIRITAPVLIVAVIAVSVPANRTYALGAAAKDENNPRGALEYIDRARLTGTLFNSYPFGGYIAWHSPQKEVFIDGRGVHLYSPDFHREYFKMLHSEQDWKAAEEKWKFDVAILEYDRKTLARHFPRHLVTNRDWALVYWDDHSAVYLKRTAANLSAIQAGEYIVSRPNLYDFSYLDEISRRYSPAEIMAQLDREIALNPANQEPRLAKVLIMYGAGSAAMKKMAMEELQRCLDLKPDLAMEHSAMATLLLEEGRGREADEELKIALHLDPADKQAQDLGRKRNVFVAKGYFRSFLARMGGKAPLGS